MLFLNKVIPQQVKINPCKYLLIDNKFVIKMYVLMYQVVWKVMSIVAAEREELLHTLIFRRKIYSDPFD